MVLQDLRRGDRHSFAGPFGITFGLEEFPVQQDLQDSRNGARGGHDLLFDRRLHQVPGDF